MVLNCLIADDDKTSQAILKAFIKKHDRLNLLGIAGNGKQALSLANKYDLNLVFLDVSMPIMNGFEFLDHLERHPNLKVILVTSEREYALKAFEYNISDYLLKPISRHRFQQAIDWIIQSAGSDHVYKPITKSGLLIRKLIQIMIASNTNVITPEPSAESRIGYDYSLFAANMNFDNKLDMLQLLEVAEREGVLSGSFVDVVQLCQSCSNNTFSIEESCPECGSLSMEKCTPKEFSTVSYLFNCGYCSAQHLKPELKVRCENCRTIQDIDYLHRQVLKKYRLTEVGKKLAEGNLYFKDEQLREEINSGPE